jgi:hypothetical protein
LSTLSKCVLQTLNYFAFFKHALTLEEVWHFLNCSATKEKVEETLELLTTQQHIVKQQHLFALTDCADAIKTRQEGIEHNKNLKRIGLLMGKLIGVFPFVKAVFISGSVSKNGAKADDDVDFFIIAQAGRVWVAKLFLIAFKKLFLFNSKKYFCINFIIGTDNLEITKKNIYTATEAVSVIPITQNTTVANFQLANKTWLASFFPNHPFVNQSFCFDKQQLIYEPKGLWDQIDNYCMKVFKNNSHKKYHNSTEVTILADKSKAALFPQSPEAAVIEHYKRLFHDC